MSTSPGGPRSRPPDPLIAEARANLDRDATSREERDLIDRSDALQTRTTTTSDGSDDLTAAIGDNIEREALADRPDAPDAVTLALVAPVHAARAGVPARRDREAGRGCRPLPGGFDPVWCPTGRGDMERAGTARCPPSPCLTIVRHGPASGPSIRRRRGSRLPGSPAGWGRRGSGLHTRRSPRPRPDR